MLAMLNGRKNNGNHSSEEKNYACARCGACCRRAGEVRLQVDELEPMARFLNLTVHDFTSSFTDLRADRKGLVLKETENGICIFLKDNLCRIHPVKPRQCREFPIRWQIPGFEPHCRAQRMLNRQEKRVS